MMTIFDTIRNHLNHVGVNGRVSRQKLFWAIEVNGRFRYSEHTVDNIKCMLTSAGYLKQVGRGQYKVCKFVPEDLTMPKLREQAYGYKRTKR